MNKKDKVFSALLLLCSGIIFSCLIYQLTLSEEERHLLLMKEYEVLTLDEMGGVISDLSPAVIYIGSASCEPCLTNGESLHRFAKSLGTKRYYLDIGAMSEEEADRFKIEYNIADIPAFVSISEEGIDLITKQVLEEKGVIDE